MSRYEASGTLDELDAQLDTKRAERLGPRERQRIRAGAATSDRHDEGENAGREPGHDECVPSTLTCSPVASPLTSGGYSRSRPERPMHEVVVFLERKE